MERKSGRPEGLRPAANGLIAQNARLLETVPRRTPEGRRPGAAPNPLAPLSALPGGVAEGLEKHLAQRAAAPATGPERLARRLTKGHLKGVGWVSDAAELATAEDKARAVAGIAGGRMAAGAAAFVPPQLITVPLASVAGSAAGQWLYDRHGDDVRKAVASELTTLGDQLGRELRRYAPYDLPDRILRR